LAKSYISHKTYAGLQIGLDLDLDLEYSVTCDDMRNKYEYKFLAKYQL